MNIKSKINEIECMTQYKIMKWLYENPNSTPVEIAKGANVRRGDVSNCFARVTRGYGFRLEYYSANLCTGGYTRHYAIADGEAGVHCVDKKRDRTYTLNELKDAMQRRYSKEHEETLIWLDAQSDYVSVRELADWAMISSSSMRMRITRLQRSLRSAHIHRMEIDGERRLKLIDFDRETPKSAPEQQTATISNETLINSVFGV